MIKKFAFETKDKTIIASDFLEALKFLVEQTGSVSTLKLSCAVYFDTIESTGKYYFAVSSVGQIVIVASNIVDAVKSLEEENNIYVTSLAQRPFNNEVIIVE